METAAFEVLRPARPLSGKASVVAIFGELRFGIPYTEQRPLIVYRLEPVNGELLLQVQVEQGEEFSLVPRASGGASLRIDG